jgi:hypothetical protein
MKEEFLHFIWKHQLFDKDSLITTEGETVKIISPGTHNALAGPDFLMQRSELGLF